MRLIFDCCYLCLAIVTSPVLLYRRLRHGKYRHGWSQKLLGRVPIVDVPGGVWFHAVSVGEVNVLVPLVRELRRQWPNRPIMISTTSQTGFELAKDRFPDDVVSFAPLDFSWAVREGLNRWQPELLVLIELELWPNLVRETHRRGIRTAIVNGRLSRNSFAGYRRLRRLVGPVFRNLDLVAAQNQTYADRFLEMGVSANRLTITGSTKFDQAQTDRANEGTHRLRKLFHVTPDDLIFIAGSTQAPEEAYALDVFRRLRTEYRRLRLVLVPRHRERFDEVAKQLAATEFAWTRRTELESNPSPSQGRTQFEVLLVDTIGELGDWWGLADVAFVGGSFGSRGGQNMLEPAAFGVPTCFGPRTDNFRDISQALVEHQAAAVVHSLEELHDFVKKALNAGEFGSEMGRRAQDFVLSHQGAIAKTCDLLLELDNRTRVANRLSNTPHNHRNRRITTSHKSS